MLPEHDPSGNLPPGIHWATWDEIVQRLGKTPYRQGLLSGFKRALIALKQAGCRVAYLDGRFATTRLVPGDFDGCWEEAYVDLDVLDPVLFDFSNGRVRQKAKYGGELFPAGSIESHSRKTFLEFFQEDKETGEPKGIVAIDLRSLQT